VIAVEENRQAVQDGARNVEVNRIDDRAVRFLAARVEDALASLERRAADLVVLDPPRQGCPPRVLDAVFGRIQPPRAVYVSCNPAALAAELPAILAHGYRLTSVQPVDMFPHTPHVEAVAVLDRTSSAARPAREARPHPAHRDVRMRRR
jgi:23S rRNA (uracil1939-C5)-methyltransferase